ncbi:MAG: YciC family protein [Clostridia bacterium]
MFISLKECKKHSLKLLKNRWKNTITVMIFVIGIILLSAAISMAFIPKNFDFNKDVLPFTSGISIALIVFAVWVPLLNGCLKYCINLSREEEKITDMIYPLGKKFFRNLLAMFVLAMITTCGFMMFFIPGIYIFLMYSMVPCILMEDENISMLAAMKKSRKLTSRKRGRILWLNVSFIPWFITIPITFNISAIFVVPYYATTLANLYRTLLGEKLQAEIKNVVYTIEDEKPKK